MRPLPRALALVCPSVAVLLLLALPPRLGAQVLRPLEEWPRSEEEVTVFGERPRDVRGGVVQVRVQDDDGVFVGGLTAEDFRINGGRVAIEAAAEVRLTPAFQFFIDYTVPDVPFPERLLEEELPKEARKRWRSADREDQDPHLYYAAYMAYLARRFPEGISAIQFLTSEGTIYGRVEVAGRRTEWIPNESLLDLLLDYPAVVFPEKVSLVSTWSNKRLLETLRASTERYDRIVNETVQGIMVVFSDGYEGNPYDNYYPSCCTVAGCFPIYLVGCNPLPREDRVYRENRLKRTLAERRIRPLVVLQPLRRKYPMDAWRPGDPLAEMWRNAVMMDQTRFRHLAANNDGEALDRREYSGAELAETLVREVEERLRYYWIAWRTPEEEGRGEDFLRITVPGREGLRVEPERMGEAQLESGDPYLLRHLGPLEQAPWDVWATLRPAQAVTIALAGNRLEEALPGMQWRSSRTCPYLLDLERSPPPSSLLERALLSALERARPAGGPDPAEAGEFTREFLAGAETVLDLCRYVRAAFAKAASPETAGASKEGARPASASDGDVPAERGPGEQGFSATTAAGRWAGSAPRS